MARVVRRRPRTPLSMRALRVWDRGLDRAARMLCGIFGHGPLPGTAVCFHCGKELS